MKFILKILFILIVGVSAISAEELVIVGTGSGTDILKALAHEFETQNPGVTISVPKSIGSTLGIMAINEDEFILGRIARDLTDKEQRLGLTVHPFAKMPIVIFTNPSTQLTNITSEQVCNIFDGSLRKWDELGSGKGKIRVIRREDGDSSLEILRKMMPGFEDLLLTKRAKIEYSDGNTVKEVVATKNTVAFGTWPNTMHEDGVVVLNVDGITPSDSKYPCSGMLSLIYKKEKVNQNMADFFNFLKTSKAAKIIADNGGVSVESLNEN